MSLDKKKFIPKLKKSLKNFLTDESGKITKKDALGLSAGAAILGLASTVDAAYPLNAKVYIKSESPALPYPSDASVNVPQRNPVNVRSESVQMTRITSATCNHAS